MPHHGVMPAPAGERERRIRGVLGRDASAEGERSRRVGHVAGNSAVDRLAGARGRRAAGPVERDQVRAAAAGDGGVVEGEVVPRDARIVLRKVVRDH